MRKIYFTILFAGIVTLYAVPLKSQVRFGVSINLGSQPVWGPVGHDYVENYYMPDIEAYYNVPQRRFYYNEGGRWIYGSSLPSRYRDYDLYNSYKVVVNDRSPWNNHNNYRDKYSSYRGRRDQQPIRDSRDSKYYVIKNHPEHNNWVQQQRHDNGNHNGWYKGNNGNGNGNGRGNDNKGNGNGNGNGNNGNGRGNGRGNGKNK